MSPLPGSVRVVVFRLRGKRVRQQGLVAALSGGTAKQAKRLNQSRYGPVAFAWTRTMSIPFHCRGATTV